jgi:hypothetical protein
MKNNLANRAGLAAVLISLFACVMITANLGLATAQRKSPHETVETTINGKKVSITYGRPYVKGRQIVGGIVPYDKVWRTGADEATTLVTEGDLMIGNLSVPKGTYTLYTLPSASGWKLIVNKQTGQWGTVYQEAQDLGRVDLKVAKTSAPVEQFTIYLDKDAKGGVMRLEWENTRASVPFTVK